MSYPEEFVLFALPDDVLSLLFRQWLDISDFLHLDTALCSHFQRKEYFRILQIINGIVTTDSGKIAQKVWMLKPTVSASILQWFTTRKLFLSQWKLQPEDTFLRYHMFQVFGVSNLQLLLDIRHVQNLEETLLSHFQNVADMLKLRTIFWEQNKFTFNLSFLPFIVDRPNAMSATDISLSNWPHHVPTRYPFHVLKLSNHASNRYDQPAIVIKREVLSIILPYLSSLQTLILDNVCFESSVLHNSYALLSENCRNLRVLYFFRNEINVNLLRMLFVGERVILPLLEAFITDGCFFPEMEPEDPPLYFPSLLSNEFQAKSNNQLMHLKHIETECLLACLLVQLAPNIAFFDISYIWDWYGKNYQYLPLQAFADHLYRSYSIEQISEENVNIFPSLQVLHITFTEDSCPSSLLPLWLNTQFFRPKCHQYYHRHPWSNLRKLHFNGNLPLQEDIFLCHLLPNIPKYMKNLQELSILCVAYHWDVSKNLERRFTSYSGEMEICCSMFRQYQDMYENQVTDMKDVELLVQGIQTYVMLWLLDLTQECPALMSLKLHDVYPLSFHFALQQFQKIFPTKSIFFANLTSLEVRLSRALVRVIHPVVNHPPVKGFIFKLPMETQSLNPIDINSNSSNLVSSPVQHEYLFPFSSMHTLVLAGTWLTDSDVLPFFNYFNTFTALLHSSSTTTSVQIPSCRLRKLAMHSPQFTSRVFRALLRMVLSSNFFCRELSFLSFHVWSDFTDRLNVSEVSKTDIPNEACVFHSISKGLLLTMCMTVFLTGLKEFRLFIPSLPMNSEKMDEQRIYKTVNQQLSLKDLLSEHHKTLENNPWTRETSAVLRYLQAMICPSVCAVAARNHSNENEMVAFLYSLFYVSWLRRHSCVKDWQPAVSPDLCSYKYHDVI